MTRRLLLASSVTLGVSGAVVATTQGVSGAWDVSAQASAECQNGVAVIFPSFTNTEAPGSGLAIKVTAVVGKVSEGTKLALPGGPPVTWQVTTASSSLRDASVTFEEVWANGQPGTDSISASVPDLTCSVPMPPPTTTTTVPPTTTTTTVPPTTTTTTTVPTIIPPTTITVTPPPAPTPAPAPVVVPPVIMTGGATL